MSSKDAWLERVEDLVAELESDGGLRIRDFIEVADELIRQATTAVAAKREELDRGGR